MDYDYLVVGAGLTGATFAHIAGQMGKKCLVIDKRKYCGGNVYTETIEGITVHKYGAHIFHTADHEVWDFISDFAKFNRFTNSPLINSEGKLYNLPFNMNTFYQLWNVRTPEEARKKIKDQQMAYTTTCPVNLEEKALMSVGTDIYNKLIKGYTEKQWGRSAAELPAFIIQRLPLRFTYDNNYFDDPFQGVPIGGYTPLIHKMLDGIPQILDTDFNNHREELCSKAKTVIYTGRIDEYYDFCYGKLEYRSLRFEDEILPIDNYQGNAVINYGDKDIPYTRVIEHKHFECGTHPVTVITREYPQACNEKSEAFYPVNDNINNLLYSQYKERSAIEKKVIFAGRLGEYKYYNMDLVVRKMIDLTNVLFN